MWLKSRCGEVQSVLEEETNGVGRDMRTLEGREDYHGAYLCAEICRGGVDVAHRTREGALGSLGCGFGLVEDGKEDPVWVGLEMHVEEVEEVRERREGAPGEVRKEGGVGSERVEEGLRMDRWLVKTYR